MTGYAGSELARILYRHPEVEITCVTGRSAAGKRLPEAMPHLWQIDLPVTSSIEEPVDVVFSALPSGASAEVLAPLVDQGVKAIDIAADFRLRDPEVFNRAYNIEHPAWPVTRFVPVSIISVSRPFQSPIMVTEAR